MEAVVERSNLRLAYRRVVGNKGAAGVDGLTVSGLADWVKVQQPMFEPGFSESSYGYRPGRSAQQAMQAARRYVREGRGWVVDLDLERFFDMVNHDVLMSKVEHRVKDRRVLKLIRRYLEAGLMRDGLVQWRAAVAAAVEHPADGP